MIELYWGGKLYRFDCPADAEKAGFRLGVPDDLPVVDLRKGQK